MVHRFLFLFFFLFLYVINVKAVTANNNELNCKEGFFESTDSSGTNKLSQLLALSENNQITQTSLATSPDGKTSCEMTFKGTYKESSGGTQLTTKFTNCTSTSDCRSFLGISCSTVQGYDIFEIGSNCNTLTYHEPDGDVVFYRKENKQDGTSLSGGAIAGIAVGGLVAVIAVGAAVFIFWKRHRNSTSQPYFST